MSQIISPQTLTPKHCWRAWARVLLGFSYANMFRFRTSSCVKQDSSENKILDGKSICVTRCCIYQHRMQRIGNNRQRTRPAQVIGVLRVLMQYEHNAGTIYIQDEFACSETCLQVTVWFPLHSLLSTDVLVVRSRSMWISTWEAPVQAICDASVQTKHDLVDVGLARAQGISVPRLVPFHPRHHIYYAYRPILRY